MTYVLKLYVLGETPNSRRAISNLEEIAREFLRGQYEMEIIDIGKNPQLAVAESIVATPTLIKSFPPPLRKVIGDLSDTERVLLGLSLKSIIEESAGKVEEVHHE